MDKATVLFLCTGNSCRSQMAEGWARHLHPNLVEPYSAGVLAGMLNGMAVRVMAEAGVDISRQRSKAGEEVAGIPFDLVVTVCDRARESCPVFPSAKRMMHKSFDDPPDLAQDARTEEEALGIYRRVRDEIRSFVERVPEILATPNERNTI